MLDGYEIEKVCVVGRVLNINRKAVQTTYMIHDSTGVMECNLWLNDSAPQGGTARDQEIKENKYVRIVGQLKSFNEKRTVNAFMVRPITDHNQVTHHKLSVIATHIRQKMRVVQDKTGMKPMVGQTNATMGQAGNAGMTELQKVLVGIFEEEQDPEVGMAISDVMYRLCSEGTSENDVRNAIAEMTGNGLLYATIDEEHFRYVNA